MRSVITIFALALVFACAPPASAQQGGLPAFSVHTPDGREVPSSALTTEQKWLLVYVSPGCRACETFMRALPGWQSPALLSRLVLVVGGKTPQAQAWIQKTLAPELSALTWYTDPDRQAWDALELPGAPVLMGIQWGKVEWQLGGVLNDPAALTSVVRSWVE